MPDPTPEWNRVRYEMGVRGPSPHRRAVPPRRPSWPRWFVRLATAAVLAVAWLVALILDDDARTPEETP